MKYRVLQVGDEYFPQYKSWWTFGWRNFKEHWFGGGATTISYACEEKAIDYCTILIEINTTKPKQVVWESNPEYPSMTTGPE